MLGLFHGYKPREARRPGGGSGGVASPPSNLPENALNHFVQYGQSLSIGTTPSGAAVVSAANPAHKMLSAGVRCHIDQLALNANENAPMDPAGCAALVDLAEAVSSQDPTLGETMASGIASRLTSRHAFTATGRGSYSVEKLRRAGNGVFTDANHFTNTHAAMLYVRDAAEAMGWTYTIPAFGWKQGEADAHFMTPRATWKARVAALHAELIAAAAAAGHVDASGAPLITDQLAFRDTSQAGGTGDAATGYGSIATAAIEMHRAGQAICVGPTYDCDFVAINDLHLTSQGYRDHGERWGLALAAIEAGQGWNPCHITAASRSGTMIALTVHVPVAPLVIDADAFDARPFDNHNFANHGFTYSGANITDVRIPAQNPITHSAVIEITLDADAPGTLRYAYENARYDYRNEVGGHIRDSAAETTASGKSLWNWLCTDEWEIA